MKREADNNRVHRAMEHAMAAITNINSIKAIDRTPSEDKTIEQAKKLLADKLPLYWGQVNADNTDRFIRLFKKYVEEQQ